MTKREYIDILNKSLGHMPAADRDEILYDYQEHFRNGLAEGKSEADIAASLGDPRSVARQFTADFHVRQAEADTSISNTFKAVLATLGLGFFNLVFVLGPFLALLGVLFALFVAAAAIIISGVAVFAATIFGSLLPVAIDSTFLMLATPAAMFFVSIGLICLGLLFFIGDIYLAKFLFIGTVQYLKFNLKIIKGV
jgi:uncharacterized membrane protein